MLQRLFAICAVFSVGALLALSSLTARSATSLPYNWVLSGSAPKLYSVDVADKTLRLSSETPSKSYGTAMQEIAATYYAGKNVRFSADVRSADVQDWAGLWMSVDGTGNVLAFDNMQSRPIKGTTEWKNYSVVLPVDASAVKIAFGVLLQSSGTVWIKNLSFGSVGSDVGVTASSALPLAPNLDFPP